MNLTRRDWLRLLLAAPLAATVDVEQLLWRPKPIITVPGMPYRLYVGDIIQIHDAQRRYNYFTSRIAELVALEPKAPFYKITGVVTSDDGYVAADMQLIEPSLLLPSPRRRVIGRPCPPFVTRVSA